MGFQVRVLLLLFRSDSLPFVRSAIFVGAFRTWLDAHAKFPFLLGLLSTAMLLVQSLAAVNAGRLISAWQPNGCIPNSALEA